MLPKKAIEEYKEIYKKEFGKEISDSEAVEQGTRLINLMKVIYKPIPKEWLEKQSKAKPESVKR